MEQELLLISLSLLTTETIVLNGGGAYENVLKNSNNELMKIFPQYYFLNIVLNNFFTPLKPALHNLDKNVCFLDIRKTNNVLAFIVGCDWCSICNGIIETAKQNIIKNPKLLKLIFIDKLKLMNKHLDYILIDRTEKVLNKNVEIWAKKTFGKITPKLFLLSQIYLKIESIELRWCPFKRSREFYYRNSDKKFLEPTHKIIHEVGKILSTHETITCNNCPKVINSNWKYTKSNTQSMFQPLLDFMMREINK